MQVAKGHICIRVMWICCTSSGTKFLVSKHGLYSYGILMLWRIHVTNILDAEINFLKCPAVFLLSWLRNLFWMVLFPSYPGIWTGAGHFGSPRHKSGRWDCRSNMMSPMGIWLEKCKLADAINVIFYPPLWPPVWMKIFNFLSEQRGEKRNTLQSREVDCKLQV